MRFVSVTITPPTLVQHHATVVVRNTTPVAQSIEKIAMVRDAAVFVLPSINEKTVLVPPVTHQFAVDAEHCAITVICATLFDTTEILNPLNAIRRSKQNNETADCTIDPLALCGTYHRNIRAQRMVGGKQAAVADGSTLVLHIPSEASVADVDQF